MNDESDEDEGDEDEDDEDEEAQPVRRRKGYLQPCHERAILSTYSPEARLGEVHSPILRRLAIPRVKTSRSLSVTPESVLSVNQSSLSRDSQIGTPGRPVTYQKATSHAKINAVSQPQ
ncbi:hypothetical protein OIDMADRAFT_35647 [Oidiodendron maius Zn]|uniref:Uncharacterized protein n=1 Tax=Oidiodendron maius (strain Zn) TaxID=913774 RepID=A0A0C3GQ63_OIDMZ|nr:hypothetical protein OIDMADRAFT_35647 [Oidiodendron maius Zn]